MRDKNRYHRNKKARKNIRAKVLSENRMFYSWTSWVGHDAYSRWMSYVDWLVRGREGGFHRGSIHAPAWFRRGHNRTLRAKNRQTLRDIDKKEDLVFYEFKKNADWDFF